MQPQSNRTYTWTEMREWDGDERWELIDGIPYAMFSPSLLHQALAMELSGRLYPQFRDGRCRLLAAPFDVKLSERDVVQPDLLVICEQGRLQPGHLEGPPELAVEILSPSNERHDRLRKLNLYARSGVSEYWLITPYPFLFEVLRNRNGTFEIAGSFCENDLFASPAFPHLQLDLKDIHQRALREAPPPYSTV